MECNKEEARRAMDVAERKISENDYNGAKKYINKAQSLYPTLDGLKQVLMMIDVYISASNGGGESDLYGILGVDPLADDEALKKHYKNLALLLHPDKNRFNGAEGAFKLVLDAWSLLSDKSKRIAYDQKRNPEQRKSEPASCNKPESASSSSSKPLDVTFSTVCNRCTTKYCQFVRSNHLNKTFPCPNCGQDTLRTNMFSTEMINGKLFVRISVSLQEEEQSSANSQATSKKSSTRDDDANSTHEAQRFFKKLMTATTGDANSTDEAQRLFKNP